MEMARRTPVGNLLFEQNSGVKPGVVAVGSGPIGLYTIPESSPFQNPSCFRREEI